MYCATDAWRGAAAASDDGARAQRGRVPPRETNVQTRGVVCKPLLIVFFCSALGLSFACPSGRRGGGRRVWALVGAARFWLDKWCSAEGVDLSTWDCYS